MAVGLPERRNGRLDPAESLIRVHGSRHVFGAPDGVERIRLGQHDPVGLRQRHGGRAGALVRARGRLLRPLKLPG